MKQQTEKAEALLALIREGKSLTFGQQLKLTAQLSIPSIVAQLSSIVMQYIDASMVGSLGADASASIGLVSTTTWLFGGLCMAATAGFSVQVAHRIGANDFTEARAVLRQGLVAIGLFGLTLALIGVSISGFLPGWLGGDEVIRRDASLYFFIYALFLPVLQMNFLAGSMLRCSGNMHMPSLAGVLMCVLDVIFNFFLIFPSRDIRLGSFTLFMPGAGLGVEGAALGTVLAETIAAGLLLWFLLTRSPQLRLTKEHGRFRPTAATLRKALHIGLPMGIEHAVICGAQIMTTVIVAPLGIFAIAANSFAITAESLCYMPGYGIADAATTLVGQSMGAGRRDLTRRFAYITVFMGMLIMGLMGVIMYVAAPQIIGVMTPVDEIRELGVMALRIEAFAEPMFAAAIVAYGVFVGAASTLIPCLMNFFSIWAVRLSLAALLAPTLGLKGVWIAMCVELCFRGVIFLIRLFRGKWLKTIR
ncbi:MULTISPECIES: MATE family efflux transporter [Mediterranea]|uniref:MATE family efflux transporter n=1 Tax=Mediterranea TaxID=1926659 RepID=UPI0020110AA3|nr:MULTISPECIES: MATE family efflux transporter [Mediterranea]MCL1606423.1 MATE family efflux transporter [Mediterranea sp. ET5]MDM8121464.1 MATE family efflux transporter [Mediterranea massiliensis]MDM8198177.1 MATE family efflux transporter [Mediterranea massiliensis]